MAPSTWMLVPRSIAGDIQSVPQTFSSWHNCMQQAYCKWPAIIGIVVASLVILSIVWCCARCLCCGLSCCCECFSCFACCDSCRGRRKSPRSNYADGPPAFAPYQGYQPAPNPPVYEPQSFATFDAPSKAGRLYEDSLPAMPSWDAAASRRVEQPFAHNDMEMGHLATGSEDNAAHTKGGYYSQVPDQPASPYGHAPAEYRGANMTHPYGSDLGAQRLATEPNQYPGYDTSPTEGASYAQGPSYNQQSDGPFYGSGSTFLASSPAPTYQTYAPTQPYSPTDSTRYAPTSVMGTMNISPTQVRPPGLLQVGRKPLPGSGREI